MRYLNARESPSACAYENRRQRIKSLKIVVEISDKQHFFLGPQSIYKAGPTITLFDVLYLGQIHSE